MITILLFLPNLYPCVALKKDTIYIKAMNTITLYLVVDKFVAAKPLEGSTITCISQVVCACACVRACMHILSGRAQIYSHGFMAKSLQSCLNYL